MYYLHAVIVIKVVVGWEYIIYNSIRKKIINKTKGFQIKIFNLKVVYFFENVIKSVLYNLLLLTIENFEFLAPLFLEFKLNS